MKTAEELFEKYKHESDGGEFMYFSQFNKALADYKQSIIALVDELIDFYDNIYHDR